MGDQYPSAGGRSFIRVVCGAQDASYDVGPSGGTVTISGLRRHYREILNIRDEHSIVFVDGRMANDPTQVVRAGQEVEFKKQAGQKG